jgi:hypothetical protein
MPGEAVEVALRHFHALVDRAAERGALVAVEIDALLVVLDDPFRHEVETSPERCVYGTSVSALRIAPHRGRPVVNL